MQATACPPSSNHTDPLAAPVFTLFAPVLPGILVWACVYWLFARCIRLYAFKHMSSVTRFQRCRLYNLSVCWTHSTISSCWALSVFVLYPCVVNNYLLPYTACMYHLPEMTCGYLLHDSIDMLYYEGFTRWTQELLAHHVVVFCYFIMALSHELFLPYAALALLMEAHSTIMHTRTIVHLCRWPLPASLTRALRALNLLMIIGMRFGVQLHQTHWIIHQHKNIHSAWFVFACVGECMFLYINGSLLKRVLRADHWLSALTQPISTVQQPILTNGAVQGLSLEAQRERDAAGKYAPNLKTADNDAAKKKLL